MVLWTTRHTLATKDTPSSADPEGQTIGVGSEGQVPIRESGFERGSAYPGSEAATSSMMRPSGSRT